MQPTIMTQPKLPRFKSEVLLIRLSKNVNLLEEIFVIFSKPDKCNFFLADFPFIIIISSRADKCQFSGKSLSHETDRNSREFRHLALAVPPNQIDSPKFSQSFRIRQTFLLPLFGKLFLGGLQQTYS